MKRPEPKPADKRFINRYKMAHMCGVAEYMYMRAEDYNLDPEQMYVLGLLHDIGYLEGRNKHEVTGAAILTSMGMDPVFVEAVLNHGDVSNTPVESLSAESILLVEADCCIGKEGYFVGPKARLAYVKNEYHVEEPMKSNIEKVKEYCRIHSIKRPFVAPQDLGQDLH